MRTGGRCTTPTRSCACSSTASSCTSCAVPTCCPTTSPRCAGSGARSATPPTRCEQLDKQWRYHRREVRRLHEKLFYRPLLSAVARIPGDEVRLSPEAARTRLAALGYEDPIGRAAAPRGADRGRQPHAPQIQRTLLPVMLEWFADAPDPDAGLFGFRRISEALGRTPWYLRLLRDEGEVAQRMAQVLATSRYATDLLQREPQGVAILGEDEGLRPLGRDAVEAEMHATAERRDDVADAVTAIRAIRRRELLRISVADLTVPFGVAEVGYALTDVTSADARGDARGRDPLGRGRARRADADPDGDRRDGPLRRVRARLRQRRRRDVRPRPAARRRPHSSPRRWPRRWPTTYAGCCPSTAGPGAGDRRRPAPRGSAGPAGAFARLLRRLLRQVVGGVGGAGAAACRADWSATPTCASASPS